MKIADSNVNMMSTRQYEQRGEKSGSNAVRTSSFVHIASDIYESSNSSSTSTGSEEWLNYGRNGLLEVSRTSQSTGLLQTGHLQKNVVIKLLERLSKGVWYENTTEEAFQAFQNGQATNFPTNFLTVNSLGIYEEHEAVTFQTQGRAVTEDGRTIDFQIDLMMSRSYMETVSLSTPAAASALVDPLIINVGSDVADLSDQTFLFDLDADGTKEEIPMLGSGSGFLALDLNEDGIINDGSELFGTKSGNGFEDLRQYDSDGNGWIDENDEIFSKLKVWCKGADGEDVLMNLKEADIGAIFLGEQATEFTMDGGSGINGVVRSTGFFLRESGSAGTVQHVDLAVKDFQEEKGVSLEKNQPILYTENQDGEDADVISRILNDNGSNSSDNIGNGGSSGNTNDGGLGSDKSKSSESSRSTREQRRRALEERRLRKKEQQRLLEERIAKHRAENRQLAKQAAERRFEHQEELRESYEWLRFQKGYHLV